MCLIRLDDRAVLVVLVLHIADHAMSMLQKCDDLILMHLGFLDFSYYYITIHFYNLDQASFNIRSISFDVRLIKFIVAIESRMENLFHILKKQNGLRLLTIIFIISAVQVHCQQSSASSFLIFIQCSKHKLLRI